MAWFYNPVTGRTCWLPPDIHHAGQDIWRARKDGQPNILLSCWYSVEEPFGDVKFDVRDLPGYADVFTIAEPAALQDYHPHIIKAAIDASLNLIDFSNANQTRH